MADNLNNKLLQLLLGTPSTPEVDGLKKALSDALAKAEIAPTPTIDAQKHTAKLQELYGAYAKRHTLSPGQIVRWKPGMRNRGWPAYDQPGIVVELLAEPVFDLREPPNSTTYREPLDIRIGVYWEPTNELYVYFFNSRRFEPIVGPAS